MIFEETEGGGGVGGSGVHLFPQLHQDYTFSHRKSCSQFLGQQLVRSPRKLLFEGNFWLVTQKGFPVDDGCGGLV